MKMKVVILGGNVAGSNAADIIKKENPSAIVEIYSEESYFNYTRIKLPAFLCGMAKEDDLITCSADWYKKRNIVYVRNNRATKIDPKKKQVHFENKKMTTYDKLLLCVGSRSNILRVGDVDAEGLFTLKTLDDALKIKSYAKEKESAIVIGGGLLGLEIAKSLSDLNLKVTVLEFFPRLLPRQLDVEGAEMLEQILRDFNIEVALNASTKEIDMMVDIACSVPGVAGAQIAGAGLGGCIMIMARKDAVDVVRRALVRKYYRPCGLKPVIINCITVAGAGLVEI